MLETSIHLQTQASVIDTSVSFDSAGRPIISSALSEAKRQTKYKPRFAEFACGPGEVRRNSRNAVEPRFISWHRSSGSPCW